jgi:hypothetical protein
MNFKNRFFEVNEIKPSVFEYKISALNQTNKELN